MENHRKETEKQTCFVINNHVWFYPDEHKLIYISESDNKKQVLNINIPASRCLVLLIENRNVVISREDFFEHVWKAHGCFVAQNTYYQNISILRRSLKTAGLCDDVIVTVPRSGLKIGDDVQIEKIFTDEIYDFIARKVEFERKQESPPAILNKQVKSEVIEQLSGRASGNFVNISRKISTYMNSILHRKISVVYAFLLVFVVMLSISSLLVISNLLR